MPWREEPTTSGGGAGRKLLSATASHRRPERSVPGSGPEQAHLYSNLSGLEIPQTGGEASWTWRSALKLRQSACSNSRKGGHNCRSTAATIGLEPPSDPSRRKQMLRGSTEANKKQRGDLRCRMVIVRDWDLSSELASGLHDRPGHFLIWSPLPRAELSRGGRSAQRKWPRRLTRPSRSEVAVSKAGPADEKIFSVTITGSRPNPARIP